MKISTKIWIILTIIVWGITLIGYFYYLPWKYDYYSPLFMIDNYLGLIWMGWSAILFLKAIVKECSREEWRTYDGK